MTTLILLLLIAVQSHPPAAATSPPAGEKAESVDTAWTILHNGLTDKSADRRAKATHSLGLILENSKAQELAEKALKSDATPAVRAEGATALGLMGAMSAKPKLKDALKDSEIKVVLASANALYTLKDPAAYDVYYAILTGQRKGSSGLIKSQMEMLKDKKQMEKLAFETGIGFIPFGGMSYEAFKTITHDDSSPVLALSAERLANDPDPQSGSALGHACSNGKWSVRLAVVQAINKRGDPSLLVFVGPLLYDSNDSVRFSAAATVIHLSSQNATKGAFSVRR